MDASALDDNSVLHVDSLNRRVVTISIATGRIAEFRQRLLDWYRRHRRDLPWRATKDAYCVWVSEIMLQQTRVAAVIPYYERFVTRFPDAASLAAAPEAELLALWSGLGYYSRARNLQKAARQIVDRGGFPEDYQGIRELAGVGNYTAAAVASIAFGLPHAAVDGNVLRVVSRLTNEGGDIAGTRIRRRLADEAQRLLDVKRAGAFNQALMELGATVCLPRDPRCSRCPVSGVCAALAAGTQDKLPVKARRREVHRAERSVVVVEKRGRVLLRQRAAGARKLAGFWELPAPSEVPGLEASEELGAFRHSITNHNYRFRVFCGTVRRKPATCQWVASRQLAELPLTTVTRKALAIHGKLTETSS